MNEDTLAAIKSSSAADHHLKPAVVDYLAQMIAVETKRDRSTIDAENHFDGYGIDSFLAMRMTKKLEKSIGTMDKSVFFEHTTLNSLADYLLVNHAAGLTNLLGDEAVSTKKQAAEPQPPTQHSVTTQLAGDSHQLISKTTDYLVQMVADETKRSRSDVHADSSFDALGIDSFLAMRMTKKLDKSIGIVDKTAFFEHNTVTLLATYLIENFMAELQQLFGLEESTATNNIEHINQPEHEPNKTTPEVNAGPESGQSETDPRGPIRDLTIQYLTHMVAEETRRDLDQVTPDTGFDAMGIDSFLAMRMTKKLEKSIGSISKTAFFEHQNIATFTDFLLQDHLQTLTELFADEITPISSTRQLNQPSTDQQVFAESELNQQPHFKQIIDGLTDKFGKENKALARYAIAPMIFLASNKQAYFNFNENDGVALAFTYVGHDSELQTLADEFIAYCVQHGLQGNMLLESQLNSTENMPYSANSFGVMQRLTDIKSLSLKGSKMRRLRYQISKFKSSGAVDFAEYSNGKDAKTDQAITAMIDRWAANKNMVNPYIWSVKNQIASGQLPKAHRIFLTHMNGQLQNVIIITKLACENGYLMDLEFYAEDMPLGGLEFGIWQLIKQLIAEGCESFSLGATFGVIHEDEATADPTVFSILKGLQQQGAFNGAGNLQFKNKFRPTNSTMYLCRPLNDDPETVVDVIMMIANPYTHESASAAAK